MSSVTGDVFVQVDYNYQYTARDGRNISIKQNEKYILISRTNDHWWHVKKDDQSKPFYVPAHYVKELPASPGVQSLNRSNATKNQNGGEVSETPSVFKNHCDVEKDHLLHQEHQGQNISSSDPIQEKENKPNSSPTEDKKPSLYHLGNDSPQTLPISANASQSSSVAPDLAPCYSEVNRTLMNNEESDDQKCTFTKTLKWQSATVRVNSKQRANHTQRLSLVGKLAPVQLAINPQGLNPNYGFNTTKDISPSEKANPPRRASFSHVVSPKRYSSAGIGAVIFERPRTAETKESAKSKVLPQTRVSDSENVYESIPDLPKSKTKTQKAEVHSPPKVFQENSESVYQNVTELRREVTEEPLSPNSSSTSQLEEWETHTDQTTGQLFYYNAVTGETTWDSPFDNSDSSKQHTPTSRSSSTSHPLAEWESHLDEASGQPYFYNPVTGKTTWEPPEQTEEETVNRMDPERHPDNLRDQRPPTPEEDYPEFIEGSPTRQFGHRRQPSNWSQDGYSEPQSPVDSPFNQPLDPQTPPGWSSEMDQEGQLFYTSEVTQEKWIRHVDSNGTFYYYNPDGAKSEWELPQYGILSNRLSAGNGLDQEGNLVFSNWRRGQTLKPVPPVRSDTEEKSQSLDKAGILNKAKVADNGKRIRKNWASSWTVLQGGVLTFYKDPKNQSAGSLKQAIGQIIPEYTVDLKGATIGWAAKDKSSKKNVLELKTRGGSEYLIQYDAESVIGDWYKMINESIQCVLDPVSVDETDAAYDIAGPEKYNSKEKDEKKSRTASRHTVANTAETTDHKKVKNKLRKFLLRRPTLQSVREKGYIQDQVFGCCLGDLCRRESTTVPHFVLKCIQAVEKRGLDIDGLYRVSGNLAVIQKLRFKVNHDENVNLEEGPWDDVHVITGALKLFFRELPEPLFPFNYFNSFIEAMKLGDPGQRLQYMTDLIHSLPVINHDTMQVLFRHLCNVIECRNQNRMSSQSMAIVFGPTLLKPETETGNIAVHMVYQNQIVEFVLNQYQHLFKESRELADIR
ncbi:rho GTPase-activating protein 27-like isoform X2 [Heptranchias perlo]|uniref:rho GTPase-activating protein 27-like isoform X2 n=1 Tax=Heptranchias perlo TaxID=212740 RepID=UPI00355AA8F1